MVGGGGGGGGGRSVGVHMRVCRNRAVCIKLQAFGKSQIKFHTCMLACWGSSCMRSVCTTVK